MKHKKANVMPNRILILLTCVVLILGSWLLGERHGEHQTLSAVSEQMSTAEAQLIIDQLQVSLSEKEQEVSVLLQDIKAREARAQALLTQLDEQMRENMSSASDLALYRKIENSERPRGLEVESVIWRASEPEKLEMILIQWKGTNRVTGEVRVALGYLAGESDAVIADGDSRALAGETALSDGQAATSALNDNLRVDMEAQAFDFRFFQKIKIPMPSTISASETGNPDLPTPEYVEVQVMSADNGVKTLNRKIPWKDISE